MCFVEQVDASHLTHDQLVLFVALLACSTGMKLRIGTSLEDTFLDALRQLHQLRGLSGGVISTMSELHIRKSKSTTNAKNAASARWDSRADKRLAKERYDTWKSGGAHYKSKADFAREVHKECRSIENPRTIENWVNEWRKAPAAK